MGEIIRVGMAEYKICKMPDKITTIGLGSCVGVVLYDEKTQIAGLLHAMLPDYYAIKNNTNRQKFVNSGLTDMIEDLNKAGADVNNLKAKMAGGARMFKFNYMNETSNIGEKNVKSTKEMLQAMGIPLVGEDTGLNYGRTVLFDPATYELQIMCVGKEMKRI